MKHLKGIKGATHEHRSSNALRNKCREAVLGISHSHGYSAQPVTQDPLSPGCAEGHLLHLGHVFSLRAAHAPSAAVAILHLSTGAGPSPCLRPASPGRFDKVPTAVLSFRTACLPGLGHSPELRWAQPLKALYPLLAGNRLAPLTPRNGVSLAVSPNSLLGQAHSLSLFAYTTRNSCHFEMLHLVLQLQLDISKTHLQQLPSLRRTYIVLKVSYAFLSLWHFYCEIWHTHTHTKRV